jgi:hypothetical protein
MEVDLGNFLIDGEWRSSQVSELNWSAASVTVRQQGRHEIETLKIVAAW